MMCTPWARLPAPSDTTGTGSVCARYSHTSEVVTSHMIEKQPASTMAQASSTSSFARSAVLPCAKKPPSWGMRIGAALRDVLRGVVHRLLRGQVEAHVGHVHHAQAVLRAALHRLRHEHHLLEGPRGGALVAE